MPIRPRAKDEGGLRREKLKDVTRCGGRPHDRVVTEASLKKEKSVGLNEDGDSVYDDCATITRRRTTLEVTNAKELLCSEVVTRTTFMAISSLRHNVGVFRILGVRRD